MRRALPLSRIRDSYGVYIEDLHIYKSQTLPHTLQYTKQSAKERRLLPLRHLTHKKNVRQGERAFETNSDMSKP